jgi:hypothetical protein
MNQSEPPPGSGTCPIVGQRRLTALRSTVIIGARGGYHEEAGAVRDMVQNHIPPGVRFDAYARRKPRVDIA